MPRPLLGRLLLVRLSGSRLRREAATTYHRHLVRVRVRARARVRVRVRVTLTLALTLTVIGAS